MKAAIKHLLWCVAIAAWFHVLVEVTDCSKHGGRTVRGWHGLECVPQSR